MTPMYSAVQHIEQRLDAGFHDVSVIGLEGQPQRRSGRPSHRVSISGVLSGESAVDDLATLQGMATAGDETTFAADIVSALDLQQVVISHFRAVERAGRPGLIDYALEVVESPPLPPPAQLSAFGGLDDFGLGDLGFDTDLLGDLTDLAGDIAGAVDGALDALDALEALGGLATFDFDGMLDPAKKVGDGLEELGGKVQSAVSQISDFFS